MKPVSSVQLFGRVRDAIFDRPLDAVGAYDPLALFTGKAPDRNHDVWAIDSTLGECARPNPAEPNAATRGSFDQLLACQDLSSGMWRAYRSSGLVAYYAAALAAYQYGYGQTADCPDCRAHYVDDSLLSFRS